VTPFTGMPLFYLIAQFAGQQSRTAYPYQSVRTLYFIFELAPAGRETVSTRVTEKQALPSGSRHGLSAIY
jgi:hypothetical protein